MNSRTEVSQDVPQLAFDDGKQAPQARDHRSAAETEGAERMPPDALDRQLPLDFAQAAEHRPVVHDSSYPSLSGSDEMCDSDERVVMVVDDDHAIREALKDLLGLLGFHVVSARDGEDALALLGDGCKPYAILLDLGMPRMDGWRFRSELLSDPRYAGLRVIVITASENQHPETLGVSDVLTKPVPLQRLVEVLGSQDCGL